MFHQYRGVYNGNSLSARAWDGSVPFAATGESLRDLVASHQYTKVVERAQKAIEQGEGSDELILEKLFASYLSSGCPDSLLKRFPFQTADKKPDKLRISKELYRRNHLKEALEVLSVHRNERPRCLEGHELFERWRRSYFPDVYYRFYGYSIMALQVLTTAMVLVAALLLLGSIPDSIPQVLSSLFTLFALGPVFWINLTMIREKWNRSERCSTEIFEGMIQIRHLGEVYQFSRADQETRLYQDDTDYSYISWIRHLPFVPNFVYIRATDLLRGIPLTLPLHGVADGTRFGRSFYPSLPGSLNMIGVRMGQWESFFLEYQNVHKVVGKALFSLGIFLFLGMNLFPQWFHILYSYTLSLIPGNSFTYLEPTAELVFLGSKEFYLVPEAWLPGFAFALCVPFLFPAAMGRLLGSVFHSPLLSYLLGISIVRPGILLLAFLCFYQHYFSYPNWYIPTLSLCLLFYFAFVRTRYPQDEKEVVSRVSALFKDRERESWFLKLFGLRRIDLYGTGKAYHDPVQTIFISQTHLIFPLTFMGLTLRFLVSPRRIGLPLKIQPKKFKTSFLPEKGGTQVHFGRHKVHLPLSPLDVQAQLEGAGVPLERVQGEENRPLWSKIILTVLIASTLVSVITKNHQWMQLTMLGVGILCIVLPLMESLRKPWLLAIGVFLFWQVHEESRGPRSSNFPVKRVQSVKELQRIAKTHFLNLESMGASYLGTEQYPQLRVWGPLVTNQAYESYLRSHPEKIFQFIPPYIFAQKPREDSLSLLSWHLYRKFQPLNGKRYGSALKEYCQSQGLDVMNGSRLKGGGYPGYRCGKYIGFEGLKPDQIVQDLLSYSPKSWIHVFPRSLFSRAVQRNPMIYSKLPEKIRKEPEVLSWVRAWMLLVLREEPSLLSQIISDSKVANREFIKGFLRSYARNHQDLKGFRQVIQVSGIMESLSDGAFFEELVEINPLFSQRFPLWNQKITPFKNRREEGETPSLSKAEIEAARLLLSKLGTHVTEEDPSSHREHLLIFPKYRKLLEKYLQIHSLDFPRLSKCCHSLIFPTLVKILERYPRAYPFLSKEVQTRAAVLIRAFDGGEGIEKLFKEADSGREAFEELAEVPIPAGLEMGRSLLNAIRSQGSEYFQQKPVRYIPVVHPRLSEKRFLKALKSRYQAPVHTLDLGKWFAMFLVKQDRCWFHRHGFQYRTDPDVIQLFYSQSSQPCF